MPCDKSVPYAQSPYPSSQNRYPYAQNLYPYSLHRCPRWFNPYHSLFAESVPALLYRIICSIPWATHKGTDSANKGTDSATKGTDEVNKGTAKAGSRLKGFEVEGV
jgi:hypothetical protein